MSESKKDASGDHVALDQYNKAMYDIIDRSFSSKLHGESMGKVLRDCFISFACAFAKTNSKRPWVPIAAVHMMWRTIIHDNKLMPLQDNPKNSVTMWLLDKMESLGLVDSRPLQEQKQYPEGNSDALGISCSFEPTCYRIHHDLIFQYAIHTLEHDILLQSSDTRCQPFCRFSKVISSLLGKKYKREINLLERFHLITSNGYIEKRSSSLHLPWYKDIPDDHYVYIHFPYHMIKSGERKMCEKASLVLQDEGFITGRMTSMGTKEGTQAQCADAELLGNSLQGLDTRKGNKDVQHDKFLLIFYATKFFLKRHILALDHSMEVDNATLRSRQEIGESFVVYGIALQQQSLWLEALDVFSEALNIFKGAELEDDNPAVLRTWLHMHSSTLPKMVLVPRNSAC